MVFPTRLFLLRHGEVEERYHRVFGGRIDMELSPRGHDQAKALAAFLRRRPIDVIYASPMRRAQQTLAPLASHCPRPAVTRPEFREVDFGDWTGLTWEQVHSRYQVSAFHWLDRIEHAAIPNAESGPSFRARVEPAVRQIVRDHAGQSVAVVCHGGVIRMMLSILLDWPLPRMASFEIDYASLTQVEHHAHKTEVTLLNFAPWRDLP
jgi:broad specificity phosphatase PhoE